MDRSNALVANLEPPEPFQPSESAFNDPAMSAETLFRFNSPPCDTGNDAPFTQCLSTAWIIVPFVRVDPSRLPPGPPARPLNGGDGINNGNHHLGIMNIRRRECDRNGNAPSIDREVVFGAVSPAIRGVPTQQLAPFFAGRLDPSTETRLRSMAPFRPRESSRSFQTCVQTPFFCQAINRRRQVLPEPQPSSFGSNFQGMEKRSTTRMPISARRSSTRGLPPLRETLGLGRSGWMSSHRFSGRMSEFIHAEYHAAKQLTPS